MTGWMILRDALIVCAFVALVFVLAALAMHGMAVGFLNVLEWF